MKKRAIVMALIGVFLSAAQALAQQKTVTGRVTGEDGAPMPGVAVQIKGTRLGTATNSEGRYSIRAEVGQVLVFRQIGTSSQEHTIGASNVLDVQLKRVATSLDEVVVTALGETAAKRSLGTSQQNVSGAAIADAQRDNFLNALQGRVAGVQVNSTSGVPGASSQITIRGVSSISSSNQPLFIVDGLPMDNKTMNTGVLASSFGGSTVSFENRGVDFTNRAADINPEDIESVTILKGPEAAALYGIDAANGAVVITTKRGTAGGSFEYNNSFRVESVGEQPDIQRVYGPVDSAAFGFTYWGKPYAPGTQFYDNVDGFFRTALTQRHNLAFSGGAPDNHVNYRVTAGMLKQNGVVPNTNYNRINLTGAGQAQATKWMAVDLSTQYSYSTNEQAFKGTGGPLLGLLAWPGTDDAANYLTPSGQRRRVSNILDPDEEIDNPYFNVDRNQLATTNNRLILNLGLQFTPFNWGNIKTNLGSDTYTNHNQILRHPESLYGFSNNGQIDVADDNTRNLTAQGLLNVNHRLVWNKVGFTGLAGGSVRDDKSNVDALWGRDFLEPNFVSVNNAAVRTSKTTISQRRLMSAFGSATADYSDYLFLTVTGRNDWTSTIPAPRNSFFYPSISTSFIFSDAFPAIGKVMTGKLRAAYAEVGRDASPYAYRPSLVTKTTSYGGYGYDFWGPNRNLRPEFAHSYEFGTELGFFNDRLGVDATTYRKDTKDQIVNNVRGSYGTGFILFNLNGATTRAQGFELTLRGTPVMRNNSTWEVIANFDRARAKVLSLPFGIPESYNSDTWLYGNVRNGTAPGLSTMSLMGTFYVRNKDGKLLIDPASGLPVRNTNFVDGGYDRQPDWTLGLSNNVTYGRFRLSMLWDFRKGGDILNATEHYLTVRGLSTRTLDRETPRVIPGVLRDGLENTANPTQNSIVVIPALNPGYYSSISEELFIEKDINWARLRDVTVQYRLPERFGQTSLFVTGTDLLLFTNYTGMDPIVNGNDAAVGGSGAVGVDYGNFPIPRGLNFGLKTAF
jgi:TonB-linked SusC/RagA family outer membrane protein